jgi:hypothetical protein
MDERDGCSKWIGFVVVLIVVILWLSGVDTIYITEQVPPPQDSWEVVYPKFRDEVSTQLLNTQELVGIVLNDSVIIKSQNANLQYSVDRLLQELGIMQVMSAEESKRQRNEQFLWTALSLILGWILGWFVPTKETFRSLKRIFSKPNRPQGAQEHQRTQLSPMDGLQEILSYWQIIQSDTIAKIFVVSILLLSILTIATFLFDLGIR